MEKEKQPQMGKIEQLNAMRSQIPWLWEIPNTIFCNLDPKNFYPITQDKEIANAREDLENQLKKPVMAFKKSDGVDTDIPLEQHLNAYLKPASLSQDEINLIDTIENSYDAKNVNFIAYEDPISFTDPKESDFARIYEQAKKRNEKRSKQRNEQEDEPENDQKDTSPRNRRLRSISVTRVTAIYL